MEAGPPPLPLRACAAPDPRLVDQPGSPRIDFLVYVTSTDGTPKHMNS